VLKVLHVISGDLWAGAEAQAYTLLSTLVRMPGLEVGAALMNEGELARRLREVGVEVCVLDERKLGSVKIFFRLRGLLHDWRPHVVHTHRQKENILGALANRTTRNVPCVRTVHGGAEHAREPGLRGMRRAALDWLDRSCGGSLQQRIILVSRELRTRLGQAFPAGKIVVIENGVDAAALTAQASIAEFRSQEPRCTHVGLVGRLVGVKRVDLFLETAALLQREWSERSWRFHVIGDGPLAGSLHESARASGIADIVTFHGHRADIATCLNSLDALVICSDHEGMPMTALEAAALEVPTVAHAVGGLAEVVAPEFLVRQHSAAGYRDGVLRALQSDGRAIARRKGRQVLAEYSAEVNAERVRSVYEQLVAESR